MSEIAILHEITASVDGLSYVRSRGEGSALDREGWIKWERSLLDYASLPYRDAEKRLGLPHWWVSEVAIDWTWLALLSGGLGTELPSEQAGESAWLVADLKQWCELNGTMLRLAVQMELSLPALLALYEQGNDLTMASVGWQEAVRSWLSALSPELLAGPYGEAYREAANYLASKVLHVPHT